MSCQQVPTASALNPYPRSIQVGEFDLAIYGGVWVAIRELARLSGGGLSLLAGTGVPTELQFETAIQIAEDWLMPHVSGLQGQVLEIADPTGRMASGLLAVLDIHATSWPLQDFERLFQNVIDLATGRTPPTTLQTHRLFVADLLLVRELAHHGQVSLVKLSTRDHR